MKTPFYLVVICLLAVAPKTNAQRLKSKIDKQIERYAAEAAHLESGEISALDSLARRLAEERRSSRVLDVALVGETNGKHTQLAQAWLQAALYHYGLPTVRVYSAGLEAGNLAEADLESLDAHGFSIRQLNSDRPDNIVAGYGSGRWTLYPKQLDTRLESIVQVVIPLAPTVWESLSSRETFQAKIAPEIAGGPASFSTGTNPEQIAKRMVYLARQLQAIK